LRTSSETSRSSTTVSLSRSAWSTLPSVIGSRSIRISSESSPSASTFGASFTFALS
jgi:hypothetical protein